MEVSWEAEMIVEKGIVNVEPGSLERRAMGGIEVDVLLGIVLVEVGAVLGKLRLRVYKLQRARGLPPLRVSLHEDTVRLQLLDQFLRALRKHRRLVHSANQIHVFTAKTLGQVDQCRVEDVISVTHTIVYIGVHVLATHEYVTRESSSCIGALENVVKSLVPVNPI